MRKALIVGIDNYPTCPLSSCVKDANDVATLLRKNADGSPNFSVRIEENVSTKGQLKSMIEQCFEGNDDVALFYFSGHGYIDSIGGYIVTPDATSNDYGVSLLEVLTMANNSNCKNKIIVLDSCYSGYLGNIPTVGQNTTIINEGVTILTASRKTEPAVESNEHGLFTELLIEALSGGAADITGNITPGGIYSYIDKALGAWEQRPVFKTNVTEFVSLRNINPQVQISTIRKICQYFSSPDSEVLLNPSFEPTNSNDVKHEIIKPYAIQENVSIFSDLQKFEGIGLVVPVGEEHMYYAAMNSKSCKLTSIGKQYWKLVKKGKI